MLRNRVPDFAAHAAQRQPPRQRRSSGLRDGIITRRDSRLGHIKVVARLSATKPLAISDLRAAYPGFPARLVTTGILDERRSIRATSRLYGVRGMSLAASAIRFFRFRRFRSVLRLVSGGLLCGSLLCGSLGLRLGRRVRRVFARPGFEACRGGSIQFGRRLHRTRRGRFCPGFRRLRFRGGLFIGNRGVGIAGMVRRTDIDIDRWQRRC